ncbi:hypothetical protein ACFY12_23685 [Streptomyces sp. NPDC001339]|uniref:hypothetical protein n=1 Tax=Streptomyces sp. NPDC001339 TaxID=3364563 RepID=UPI00368C64A6
MGRLGLSMIGDDEHTMAITRPVFDGLYEYFQRATHYFQRATHGTQFFTDAPVAVFPISWQDTGSGVFAVDGQLALTDPRPHGSREYSDGPRTGRTAARGHVWQTANRAGPGARRLTACRARACRTSSMAAPAMSSRSAA